jgi:antirestriction protein ArdC
MNCPNDKNVLTETTTGFQCPVCMYSMSKIVKKEKKNNFLDKRLKESLAESVSKMEMELMEKGMDGYVHVPWKNERWLTVLKRNYKTFRPYNGWNRVLLYWEKCDLFLTKKNIEEMGLQVDESLGLYVIGWFPILKKKTETQEEFARRTKYRKFASIVHRIFRQTDVVGLPEKTLPEDKENSRKEDAESFIKRLVEEKGVVIHEGGNEAYFRTSSNDITIPKLSRFVSSDMYYASLFHELIHWTGHKERLNRFESDTEKDTAYGREELVAEMGAAALCHLHGIDVVPDQANYIDSWMQKIKADYSILLEATGRAEKALEFLA